MVKPSSPTLSPAESDVIDLLSEILYKVLTAPPTPEARAAKMQEILAACRKRLEERETPADAPFAITIGAAIAHDVVVKGANLVA